MDEDITVLWNGRKDHPGGRQLFVEEEPEYAMRQGPHRTMRDLTLAERARLVTDARLFGVEWAVQQYHVSPLTVKAALMGRA